MSERKGLQIVGALILAVAVIFGAFLATEITELYKLLSNWHVKESYLSDCYNACKAFLWFVGAYWCWKTARTGLALFTHEERRPVLQHGNNKPNQGQGQHQQFQHPNQGHNRAQQGQQPAKT